MEELTYTTGDGSEVTLEPGTTWRTEDPTGSAEDGHVIYEVLEIEEGGEVVYRTSADGEVREERAVTSRPHLTFGTGPLGGRE